jgi:UDP-glucose 4-epimerase
MKGPKYHRMAAEDHSSLRGRNGFSSSSDPDAALCLRSPWRSARIVLAMTAETPAPPIDLKPAFAGARAVITGGLGFIGSALAQRLVALDANVLIVDNLFAGYGGKVFNVAPIRDRVSIEIADIRDVRAMRELLGNCRYLFNLAAQTSHMDSMADPETDLAINCRAQLTLLEACREVCPGARVVYASTRQIYGRPRYLPVDEAHPLHPVDVNGVNKMAGEAYHVLFHDVYGLHTASLRLTNTYGPRMRIKDARQTFIGVWLRAVLEGRPFELWDGAQLRDLTYVDDAADAFLLAAASDAAKGGVFNIGGERLSLQELAEAVVAANGGGSYETRSFPPERKRIDIGDYYADDVRFRAATGWSPQTSVALGLKRSLDYFRAHLAEYV